MNSNWIKIIKLYFLMALFFIAICSLLIFLTEKYLESSRRVHQEDINQIINPSKQDAQNVLRYFLPKRYIPLREHTPNLVENYKPSSSLNGSLEVKDYKLRVDNDGFIYSSKMFEKPKYKVFFLGGSTTECLYVDEDMRFPTYSAQLLSKRLNSTVNGYNAGYSGSNSIHSITVLVNKIIPLRPDAVVMMHNINDLQIYLFEGSYWNKSPARGNIALFDNTFKYVYLYLLGEDSSSLGFFEKYLPFLHKNLMFYLEGRLNSVLGEGNTLKIKSFDDKKLFFDFRNNLNAFASLGEVYGFKPILATQANRFTSTPDQDILSDIKRFEDVGLTYDEYKKIYDTLNNIIREVANNRNIALVDLDRDIEKSKNYMYDAVHLNTKGSELAGVRIAEILTPHLSK